MRVISALRLLLLAVTGAIAACPSLDLDIEAPGAVIACTGPADCPAGLTCSERTGLCFTPGVDATPPTATLFSLAPATLFPGAAATVVVDVNELLAAPPTMTVTGGRGGDAPAVLVAGEQRDGDLRFTFTFTVAADETAAALVGRVALVDPGDNAVEVALPAFAVDVAGPDLPAGAVTATLSPAKSHARDGDTITVTVALPAEEADAVVNGATLRQGAAALGTFSVAGGVVAPLVLQGLGEGDLTVDVELRDAVDNVGFAASNAIPVDITPPVLRIEDLRLGGVAVTERLVTAAAQSLSLVAGAGGGDILTWCVTGDIVGANGCDDDGDFRPVAEAAALTLAVPRGLARLRVVGRDRAFHEDDVELSLALLLPGDPSATVTLLPPEGQTAVKVGDALTLTGTTIPLAQVGAVIVDDTDQQLSVGVARTTADETGAFATTLIVPAGVPDGRQIAARVVPELTDSEGVRVALTATTSPGVPVDLQPPAVDLAVVGGLVQPDDIVDIAFTIDGASSAVVEGDVDSNEAVSPLDDEDQTVGAFGVDLVDGDGSREVRVTVRDGAGNTDVAIVTILVNSAIPVVQLLARNDERAAVPGVRPGSRLRFSGSTSDNTIVEQRLSFFDDAGTEQAACRQTIPFNLTGRFEGGFAIGTVAPVVVGTCATATRVRAVLVVQNPAGLRSIVEQSLSSIDVDDDGAVDVDDDFYFDDRAPVVDPPALAFDTTVPPGRDAIPEVRTGPQGSQTVLVTPTRDITIGVTATDDHAIVAEIGGNVSAVDPSVFALPGAPRAFSIGGGDGDKIVQVLVEDEVGNRSAPISTTIVLDTQRPAQARITDTVYGEVEGDDDADDLLSTFFVAGRSNAVESRARVFAFAAGDDTLNAVPTASASSADNGSTEDIDVTGLGAPVLELDLVVVDRAGNRSAPLRITRPRFAPTAAPNAVGVRPAVVPFTLVAGALQGGPLATVENLDGPPISPEVGDIVVDGPQPNFTATIALDADDGLVEGSATARVVVSGRGPNLHPDSRSFDAVGLAVDFTAPTVAADALRVVEAAGVIDTLSGLAGAVGDAAGADARAVGGLIVRVNGVAATVAADGSFGPVSLGNDAPDVITVVVEKDGADNPGTPTTLRAPLIQNIVAAPTRVKVGDLVTVTFTVDDAQAIADPILARVGSEAAAVISRSTVGTLTTVTAALTVTSTATGDKDVTVTATDALGHVATATRGAATFLDAEAPVVTIVNPTAASTRFSELSASIADVSTTTTAATVQDAFGAFFNGTTFSSPTEVLLADQDPAAGRFALSVGALFDGDDYVLRIVSVDAVGNRTERTVAFTFDVTLPVLQFSTLPVGGDSLEVPFVATIDDPDATLLASIDGATAVVVPRTGPLRVPFATFPPSGTPQPRLVRFFAVDIAGNVSAPIDVPIVTTPKLQLAGGDGTLCAVRASDRALFCWGDNRDLHLGKPAFNTITLPPTLIAGQGAPPGFIGPTRIWNTIPWRKVAVGGDVVCGLVDDGGTLDGPVQCVGSRRRGLMPIEPLVVGPGPSGPPPPLPVEIPELVPQLTGTLDLAMNGERGCAIVQPSLGQTELRCWGEPLGFGVRLGTLFETTPIPAAEAVGVGTDHACVLSIGQVFCLGRNTRGQLGPGVAVGAQAAFPTQTLTNFDDPYVELIVGPERTCARRQRAQVIDCVGDNTRGAIALAADRFNLLNEGGGGGGPQARIDATRQLTSVTDLPAVLQGASAATRTCGVGTDGRIRCLGTAAAGARGDGVKDTHARAVGLFGGDADATTWDLVATLGDTTCAVRSSDGALLCAGESGHGEVVATAPATRPVTLSVPGGGTIEDLAVGRRTVCLRAFNGLAREVFCSGDTTDNRIVAEAQAGTCSIDDECGFGNRCVENACVSGLSLPHPDTFVRVRTGINTVEVGGQFGCVSTSDGVRCAGPDGSFLGRGPIFSIGEFGRFPRADDVRDVSQQPLPFFDGRVVVGDNAACVFRLGSGGFGQSNIQCWGDNLVDGDSDVAVPVGLSGIRQVVLGRAHGCVQLDGTSGEVRCFGDDTEGVRGDGDASGDLTTVVTDDVPSVPLNISAGGAEVTLAARGDNACARDLSGAVRCWGSNRHGVVEPTSGTTRFEQAHRPHNELDGQLVAVGDDFACSANFNVLRCWGRSLVGLAQEEPPTAVSQRVVSPLAPDPPVGWQTLEAGDGFVCGRTGTGVTCLGANTAGVFGDGRGLVEFPTTLVLP